MRCIVRVWLLATLVAFLLYLPLLRWLLGGSGGGVYSTDYGIIAPPPTSSSIAPLLRYSPPMTSRNTPSTIIEYKQRQRQQRRRRRRRHNNTINKASVAISAPTNNTMTSSPWPPVYPQIYLIHVGKTGGSTIVKALRLSNHSTSVKCMVRRTKKKKHTSSTTTAKNKCYTNNNNNHHPSKNNNDTTSSKLSRSILGVYHTWSPLLNMADKLWLLHNTNVFLFTVRNPIMRLRSAYNYHRDGTHAIKRRGRGGGERDVTTTYYKDVKEYFYVNCYGDGFDSMITKLRIGGSKGSSNTTAAAAAAAGDMDDDCYTIGKNVLLGNSYRGDVHFQYNYEYYYKYATSGNRDREYTKDTPPPPPPPHSIAVIRTEYLWEDVIQLDRQLGGGDDADGSSSSSKDYWNTMKGYKVTHGSENYTAHHRPSSDNNHTEDMTSIPNSIYLCCLLYKEIEIYQLLLLLARNLSNEQKRISLNELFTACHVKHNNDDVLLLSNPFSWMEYSNGKICQGYV